MTRWLVGLGFFLLSAPSWLPTASTSAATTPPLHDELLRTAMLVLQRSVDTPSAAIPAAIMRRARGIAVIPAARRDGELHYGMGVVSARGAQVDYWTPPAMIAFQGAIGLELESSEIDFVVIALTRRGLDYLSQGRLRPMADGIFPGPIGRDTLVRMDTDLLAYVQFGDYFAGVTVRDWAIVGFKDGNASLYGRPYSTDDVWRGTGHRIPALAQTWRDVLASYFREVS
jgi:lipid-binding SYLF domain-containing protein